MPLNLQPSKPPFYVVSAADIALAFGVNIAVVIKEIREGQLKTSGGKYNSRWFARITENIKTEIERRLKKQAKAEEERRECYWPYAMGSEEKYNRQLHPMPPLP